MTCEMARLNPTWMALEGPLKVLPGVMGLFFTAPKTLLTRLRRRGAFPTGREFPTWRERGEEEET